MAKSMWPTKDGGAYKRNQNLHLWQWGSALVHQDAWRSRILICAEPRINRGRSTNFITRALRALAGCLPQPAAQAPSRSS